MLWNMNFMFHFMKSYYSELRIPTIINIHHPPPHILHSAFPRLLFNLIFWSTGGATSSLGSLFFFCLHTSSFAHFKKLAEKKNVIACREKKIKELNNEDKKKSLNKCAKQLIV